MSQGWIKLHRKIKDNVIWQDPHFLKLWMYCLVEAAHAEREQILGADKVYLKKGQFVTGRKKLDRELNQGAPEKKTQTESTWWRQLQKLEKWGMLRIDSNSKRSIVTILNWEMYQIDEKKDYIPNADPEPKVESNEPDIKDLADENEYPFIDPDVPELIQIFESEVCPLTPMQTESLAQWFTDFNKQKDIIIAAMKIAADRDKKNYGFVELLLREWSGKRLVNIDQVRTYERNKLSEIRARQQKGYGRKPIRQEQVPDWVNKEPGQTPEQFEEISEEKLQELLAIQAKYKKKELENERD